MEWSLSIDNIFVFILIFSFFRVKPIYYARVLLIGIMMGYPSSGDLYHSGDRVGGTIPLAAVSFWRDPHLYGAGRCSLQKHDEELDVEDNTVYKFMKRLLPPDEQ